MRESGFSTSPSTVNVQLSGSDVRAGIRPLLRMNINAVGVVSSSSRCSGVSATSGRSPITTSLSLLPGKLRYVGPFFGAGAAGADAIDIVITESAIFVVRVYGVDEGVFGLADVYRLGRSQQRMRSRLRALGGRALEDAVAAILAPPVE